MSEMILGVFPSWFFGVLLVLACVLASELGRFAHKKLASRIGGDTKSDAQGYMVGAVFGLLAFMISLTFSIAVDRFDERRGWVAEEANAISTTFMRASLLDEPFRSRLQSTLQQYAHSRIAPQGLWNKEMDRKVAQSRELQLQLWGQTREAVFTVRQTELASYFVEAMNRTLEIGARRELAGRAHIPTRIFNALLTYLVVASFVLGYVMGGEPAHTRLVSAFLFILFAIAILMIVDLDSAQAGALKISQAPLIDLTTALDREMTKPETPRHSL